MAIPAVEIIMGAAAVPAATAAVVAVPVVAVGAVVQGARHPLMREKIS